MSSISCFPLVSWKGSSHQGIHGSWNGDNEQITDHIAVFIFFCGLRETEKDREKFFQGCIHLLLCWTGNSWKWSAIFPLIKKIRHHKSWWLCPNLILFYCITKASGSTQSTQGTFFVWLALMTGGEGACILGTRGTVRIRETVLGRLPSTGHCIDSTLKHLQSFCEKGLLICPGAAAWG